MVARTCLIVPLYIHCLSCYMYMEYSISTVPSLVKQAFHFSATGTLTCKDGATLTSFWCSSWNKFMCNGNEIGNFVIREIEYCDLIHLGGTYFFLQNSCHFTEVWDNGIMTVLGVRKRCSFLKLLDRDPSWQQYWLGQHITDTHKWRNWHWKLEYLISK
jgi:hypothetical protein